MEDVQLIPHQKAGSAQLFVVLIDGSSSMFENDGEAIKKVYNALMRASVVGSFSGGWLEDGCGSHAVYVWGSCWTRWWPS